MVWSLCSLMEYQESFPTPQFKSIISLVLSLLYGLNLTWLLENIVLIRQTFVSKVMSLLFNILCRFDIAFLPGSKCLLSSWLPSPSTVTLESKKRRSVIVSIVSPSICHEAMGQDAMILVFWMLSFKPVFSLSSISFIKRLFRSSWLSAIRVLLSAYLRLLIFVLAILIIALLHLAQHYTRCTLHIS